MKTLSLLVLAFGLAMTTGCSQATKDKAGEAADATGEAVKSAAKDTVENTREAVDKVADKVGKAAEDTGEAVKDAADKTAEKTQEAADSAGDAVKGDDKPADPPAEPADATN